MLAESVTAYNAVRRGLMGGKAVIEVQFGEERVKYQATSETAKFLLDEITRLHRSCPSAASAAVLGLGGCAGPISVSFGCGSCGD
jgi:hypothetical protein